jgi:hypothetical protein
MINSESIDIDARSMKCPGSIIELALYTPVFCCSGTTACRVYAPGKTNMNDRVFEGGE